MKSLIVASIILLFAASPARTLGAAKSLFEDKVLVKSKTFEIKDSQFEEAFIAYKAGRIASGQDVPESAIKELQTQLLQTLIVTKLFLARATPEDQKNGEEIGKKFIDEQKKHFSSEASFNRQLVASGITPQQFRDQVIEQAVVKAVIDRELRAKISITPEQIKKFYDENMKMFQQPETVKVSHILLTTKDDVTHTELSQDQKRAKAEKIKKLLDRAKAGEDFAKLVTENSEDAATRDKNGEYTFARGSMPPEFEAASFSLKPGQISDIVVSAFGFHIIKCLEKTPAKPADLSSMEKMITESLIVQEVQKAIPAYVEQLKKEADVQLVSKPD